MSSPGQSLCLICKAKNAEEVKGERRKNKEGIEEEKKKRRKQKRKAVEKGRGEYKRGKLEDREEKTECLGI